MPCFHPLKGYRSREVNPRTGRRSIVFNRKDGYEDLPVEVRCGQCTGCRLDRSKEWAVRCHHEASLWDDNCFVTLTFRDVDLPDPPTVDVRDLQLFMKKLRKKYAPKKIRFFACGEYGEGEGKREWNPHYHLILFNHDFEDKVPWKKTSSGELLYVSQSLQSLWPSGFSSVGAATFQSAAYVARYIMKKVTGPMAASSYEYVSTVTGELSQLRPEFVVMSRRPGLGTGWLEKFQSDVWPDDFIVIDNKKHRPPRFYDGRFELGDAVGFEKMKLERKKRAKVHADNNTPDRLRVREKVQEARLNLLPRKMEQ